MWSNQLNNLIFLIRVICLVSALAYFPILLSVEGFGECVKVCDLLQVLRQTSMIYTVGERTSFEILPQSVQIQTQIQKI